MDRKLAAIIAADLVDFSKLMGADEAGTLAALSALLKGVIEPLIEKHRGRIVKLMGDGVLAEFSSAHDALNCAIAWQEATHDGRLRFRIGLNLGDVIHQDGDIFGNGVNVAARLEALAEPGGVWLSDAIHREVKGGGDVVFEDMGARNLKNIAEPVRAYRVQSGAADAARVEMGRAAAQEKPIVAISAFRNLGGGDDAAFLSDGLSEDITTELARFRTLSVIARSAASPGGADYRIEGGVRAAGDRIRVTVQLIEARTGDQVWTDRFDRTGADLFAVQDEVTRAIVAIAPGRVQEDIVLRSASKPIEEMKVFELMLHGKALRDGLNPGDSAKARTLLERAVELNPNYARAHMYLADTYVVDMLLGLGEDGHAAKSMELSRKGVSIDNNDAYLQDQLAFAYLCEGLWEDAEAQFEKALSKITTEAESMGWCGYGFLLLGHIDRALSIVEEARRLDPLHLPTLDWIMGHVLFFAGKYDEAARSLIGPALMNSPAHALLAATYAEAGKAAEAQAALARFIDVRKAELSSRGRDSTAETVDVLAGGYRPVWRRAADWEKIAAGLRKAGLPD